jgi:hypothetical protein
MPPPNHLAPAVSPGAAAESKNQGESKMFFGARSDPATRQLTAKMNVVELGVYRGPHYFSHTPMVRV